MQPIQPPEGVSEENVAKARALGETETPDDKVPVNDMLDLMGGNARAQFTELLAEGAEAQGQMTAIVDDIADKMGGERVKPKDVDPATKGTMLLQGDVKSLDRAAKKSSAKTMAMRATCGMWCVPASRLTRSMI